MNSIFSHLERAWRQMAYQNQGILRLMSPLFLPCSWIYGWVGSMRRTLYRKEILRAKSFLVPILSIGNLTVGGVGKTPFTLYLAHRLKSLGYKPAILLRGYGRKSKHPYLIHPGSFHTNQIPRLGDEASLLAFLSDFPIAVYPERAQSVETILDETDCDVILLDDGFQHVQVKRDLDLVIFQGGNPLGNRHCLPYGPLREPIHALHSAHAIILNGDAHPSMSTLFRRYCPHLFEGHMHWIGFYPLLNWMRQEGGIISTESFPPEPILLVSGIGSPTRLLTQARSYGLKVKEHLAFPDHHWFTKEDLHILTLKSRSHPIFLTEKDAIRLFAHTDISPELSEKTYVIHASWQMNSPDHFDQWLQTQMRKLANPLDPVESDPQNG